MKNSAILNFNFISVLKFLGWWIYKPRNKIAGLDGFKIGMGQSLEYSRVGIRNGPSDVRAEGEGMLISPHPLKKVP